MQTARQKKELFQLSIRDCGYNASDELVLPDKQVILETELKNLASPSFKVRLSATSKLKESAESIDILLKAVSDPRLSVSTRTIAILDYLEFHKQVELFSKVGDENSLRKLQVEKRSLREFRTEFKEAYPDKSKLKDLDKLAHRAALYVKVDIGSLITRVSKEMLASSEVEDLKSNKTEIRKLIFSIVDQMDLRPKNIENNAKLLSSLGSVKWSLFGPKAGIKMLRSLSETYFNQNMDQISNGSLDARTFLGLHHQHTALLHCMSFVSRDPIGREFFESYMKLQEDFKVILSRGKSSGELGDKGELLFYMKEFAGVFSLLDGKLYDQNRSSVIASIVKDFMEAFRGEDLERLRVLYKKNIEIVEFCSFNEEELLIDTSSSGLRENLHVFVDRILMSSKYSSEEKTNCLNAFKSLSRIEGDFPAGGRDLRAAVKIYKEHIDNRFLDILGRRNGDLIGEVVELAQRREELKRFASSSWSVANIPLQKELGQALGAYIGMDQENLGQYFSRLVDEDCSELREFLSYFKHDDFASPGEIEKIYQLLVRVENDIHSEYSPRLSKTAKWYRQNIVGNLRCRDDHAFTLCAEAGKLLRKIFPSQ